MRILNYKTYYQKWWLQTKFHTFASLHLGLFLNRMFPRLYFIQNTVYTDLKSALEVDWGSADKQKGLKRTPNTYFIARSKFVYEKCM